MKGGYLERGNDDVRILTVILVMDISVCLCRAQTATIVLRGGSEQFIEESHRSIHDALMIVKVGGGGGHKGREGGV